MTVVVNREDLEIMVKEAKGIRQLIGVFRTGEEFLSIAQSMYNSPDKVKRTGLAVNRLLDKVFSAAKALDVTEPVPSTPMHNSEFQTTVGTEPAPLDIPGVNSPRDAAE